MLLNNKKPEKGKKEVDYGSIDALNASAIKLFDKSRMDFYNQFILKKPRKNSESMSTILGTLIDFFLADCQGDETMFNNKFDEKFVMLTIPYSETKQMLILSNKLLEITKEDMVNGEVQTHFNDRFQKALEKCQIDGKFKGKDFDTVLKQWNNSEGETYFKERIDNIDKIPIDEWMISKARIEVNRTLEDPNIKLEFEQIPGVERLGKTVIQWDYNGTPAKSEIDKLDIDHNTKTIIITDIKTNYEIEEFEYAYLKYRYDIAAAYYVNAVNYWKLFIKKDIDISDYAVEFRFITIDSSKNHVDPLIYILSDDDLQKAMDGFSINGYKYKGLNQLYEEISWHMKTGIWTKSKEAHDNNSIVNLKIRYDKF